MRMHEYELRKLRLMISTCVCFWDRASFFFLAPVFESNQNFQTIYLRRYPVYIVYVSPTFSCGALYLPISRADPDRWVVKDTEKTEFVRCVSVYFLSHLMFYLLVKNMRTKSKY